MQEPMKSLPANTFSGMIRSPLNKLAVVAGIFSLLLGAIVLVGWYTHNVSLIQIRPEFVPMQFNTALGFFLRGVAELLDLGNRIGELRRLLPKLRLLLVGDRYVVGVVLGIFGPGRGIASSRGRFALLALAATGQQPDSTKSDDQRQQEMKSRRHR